MNITIHFTLAEAVFSETAQRKGIDNSIPQDIMPTVILTARNMERVRAILRDNKIRVLSWYRCLELNSEVGGSNDSHHMRGCAVDFVCPDFGSPYSVVKEIASSDLLFDQVIMEGTWVHISFDRRLRRQVLTAHFQRGKPVSYTVGL